MNAISLTVASNGRVVIPARMSEALGLRSGEKVVARIQDGALVIEPVHVAIAHVQALIRERAKPGRSPVDELIAERRSAAALE